MKTIELMSTTPRVVRANERLDAAARAMWEQDCGIVPVVDAAGALVGVVTDRDLCMASYIQGRALAEIPIAAVMSRDLATCRADDTVGEVMQKMQTLRVHRLPVVDVHGHLVGVIATNDLIRAAHARAAAVDPAAVIRTLATISAPRQARAADEAAPAAAGPQGLAAADDGAPAAAGQIPPSRQKQAARPRAPATRKKAAKKTAKKAAKSAKTRKRSS